MAQREESNNNKRHALPVLPWPQKSLAPGTVGVSLPLLLLGPCSLQRDNKNELRLARKNLESKEKHIHHTEVRFVCCVVCGAQFYDCQSVHLGAGSAFRRNRGRWHKSDLIESIDRHRLK